MERQIFKVLGKEIVEILAKDEMTKFAVVRAEKEGQSAFVLVKMFSPTKGELNNDGVEVKDKQWKTFFPIVIKASFEGEYIFTLFDLLTVNNVNSD